MTDTFESAALATFPHIDNSDWLAIQTIAIVAQSIVLIVAVLFAYRQLQRATRSSQFDAVSRLQAIVDGFYDDRRCLFETFPLDLALDEHQFGGKPPARWHSRRINEGQRRAMVLSDKQIEALKSLNSGQLEIARRTINRLNDLGQLVEDGFIPKDVFFGKYHLLILRCCHLLEPVRRQFEERSEGGNYGQKLLRLRYQAAKYNNLIPKHREVNIYITNQTSRKLIYSSPKPTPWRRVIWSFKRLTHRY